MEDEPPCPSFEPSVEFDEPLLEPEPDEEPEPVPDSPSPLEFEPAEDPPSSLEDGEYFSTVSLR